MRTSSSPGESWLVRLPSTLVCVRFVNERAAVEVSGRHVVDVRKRGGRARPRLPAFVRYIVKLAVEVQRPLTTMAEVVCEVHPGCW